MAYLKPINPMWSNRSQAYRNCEVKRNGRFVFSYPVYPRSKLYSGIIHYNTNYNPMLWFDNMCGGILWLLTCAYLSYDVRMKYQASTDYDYIARMLLIAMIIRKFQH